MKSLATIFPLAASLALSLLCSADSRAWAQPAASDAAPVGCDRQKHLGLSYDPVNVGFYEADLGMGRRACPRTEVRVGGRLGATLATAQFYGAIAADAIVSASYSLFNRGEIFATVEAFHFEYVQNATIKGTTAGLGQLTVGGSVVAVAHRGLTISPYLRVMLPTATTTPHVRTLGGEMGIAADLRPLTVLSIHGYVGVDTTAGISAGPALQRVGVPAALGIVYAPATWFALAVDLKLHFNYVAPVDYVAPAVALRFRIVRTLNLELDAAAPVAGADRHTALAMLSLGYRF